MANPILSIVIPVFNEADVLPVFLPEIAEYAQSNDFVLIFVDDASTDESAKLLAAFCQKSKSTLLRHKVNRGYGGALKTGIKACQTKYVVTMDADGQHQAVDAGRLLEFGLAKGADMVVGRRQSGNSGLYRAIGRKMIRLLAGTLVSLPIEDLNSGMKL
ncbi:MAG: glycosyltransferase family 2 protein, partial [Betaproteobacteria bacterium]|nr:glycosyltransferase family 2 protein [Betaproteobacteria bacterium]